MKKWKTADKTRKARQTPWIKENRREHKEAVFEEWRSGDLSEDQHVVYM